MYFLHESFYFLLKNTILVLNEYGTFKSEILFPTFYTINLKSKIISNSGSMKKLNENNR